MEGIYYRYHIRHAFINSSALSSSQQKENTILTQDYFSVDRLSGGARGFEHDKAREVGGEREGAGGGN